MSTKSEMLLAKGVVIPQPGSVSIGEEVKVENIEAGVVLYPGVELRGEKTLLGAGSKLGRECGGDFCDVRCGRGVSLGSGLYSDCVFLDGVKIRSGAEIRGGSLFMEHASAAHTVGCKMTVLGMHVTLGSLINFCDVFVSGGTDEPFGFTEIGSGAVHYNFTPNGLKFGSLIGPGVLGEMYGLFARSFIGGQTQVVAPVFVGSGVLVPAGVAVRNDVQDGVMFVERALSPGAKPYHPELLTQVQGKFSATAKLICHYHLLAEYFRLVRQQFALHRGDGFAVALYDAAIAMIDANIDERIGWLFEKTEQGVRVDLWSKLPHSLKLHERYFAKVHGNKLRFHLDSIREHQLLLDNGDRLKLCLENLEFRSSAQAEFLRMIEAHYADNSSNSYREFFATWPQNLQKQGQLWLSSALKALVEQIDGVLHSEEKPYAIEKTANRQIEALRNCTHLLSCLFRDYKFLLSGNFAAPELGIITHSKVDYHTDLLPIAREIFGGVDIEACDKDNLSKILRAIDRIARPVVLNWPTLRIALTQSLTPSDLEEFIQRAHYCFHGTDGLRGRVVCPSRPPSLIEAIARMVTKQELTPEIFEALARSTIYALELFYPNIQGVAVARDTRDLYAKDAQRQNIFYRSLVRGVLSTGKKVYDLGVAPIPNAPYVLAHNGRSGAKGIEVFLYKSASHNPASQDGLKVFVRHDEKECSYYLKLTPRIESAISSLLLREAITEPVIFEWGRLIDAREMGQRTFARTISHQDNFPQGKWERVSLVCDLAHGAMAHAPYANSMVDSLHKAGIGAAHWVGNAPNGRNINNNSGEDRVGAAHFENIAEISRAEIAPGSSYYGFPVLVKLFEIGQNLTADRFAFASLVDGDGDRGISLLYNPHRDVVHVFDGDKALFLQLHQAVARGNIKRGSCFAFTVESSIPFIRAVRKCVEAVHPVALHWDDSPAVYDKANLKITPVGDKYILRQQCFGGENSGHIIHKTTVECVDAQNRTTYAGNGFLANLHTISAAVDILAEDSSAEKFAWLSSPYETPKNDIVYVYFIRRELWYRDGALWQEIETTIRECCQRYELKRIDFVEEPDTLYYWGMDDEGELQFAILARLSGTENKMGVKLLGTPRTKELFATAREQFFHTVADHLKDHNSTSYHQEQSVLQLLRKKPSISLEDLKKSMAVDGDVIAEAHFMSVIEAISQKCQNLANYDGTNLSLTTRGEEYCKRGENG